MGSSIEAFTGMKSGKRKTHRGKRGGKSHSKPPVQVAPPKGLPHHPALDALAAGAVSQPSGPMDPLAAPPVQGGADPAVAHLIAALSALHGKTQAPPPPLSV